jgi:tRNA modification GTPase
MGYEQTSESSFSARRRHLEALRHASAWSMVVLN